MNGEISGSAARVPTREAMISAPEARGPLPPSAEPPKNVATRLPAMAEANAAHYADRRELRAKWAQGDQAGGQRQRNADRRTGRATGNLAAHEAQRHRAARNVIPAQIGLPSQGRPAAVSRRHDVGNAAPRA